ncbi:unnamed protein product [Allacma fusca]|uniref:Uncharacterized protein n=1 Tax=Allacma fusca TaxID=39272 RepID=A0A8J2LCW2_9HEXA|nr:unnamed protein product [Allacma fusca]
MSLRFDRKGSIRRSAKRDRSLEAGVEVDKQYFMSWSYRQCQFACDYLNLMDGANKEPSSGLVVGSTTTTSITRAPDPSGYHNGRNKSSVVVMEENTTSSLPGISRARFGSFRGSSSTSSATTTITDSSAPSSLFTTPRMRSSIAACSRSSYMSSCSNRSSRTSSGYADSLVSSCSSRSSGYGFDFETGLEGIRESFGIS